MAAGLVGVIGRTGPSSFFLVVSNVIVLHFDDLVLEHPDSDNVILFAGVVFFLKGTCAMAEASLVNKGLALSIVIGCSVRCALVVDVVVNLFGNPHFCFKLGELILEILDPE